MVRAEQFDLFGVLTDMAAPSDEPLQGERYDT